MRFRDGGLLWTGGNEYGRLGKECIQSIRFLFIRQSILRDSAKVEMTTGSVQIEPEVRVQKPQSRFQIYTIKIAIPTATSAVRPPTGPTGI